MFICTSHGWYNTYSNCPRCYPERYSWSNNIPSETLVERFREEMASVKAERDRYKRALEFYACPDSWNDTIKDPNGFDEYTSLTDDDIGTKAREALKGGA